MSSASPTRHICTIIPSMAAVFVSLKISYRQAKGSSQSQAGQGSARAGGPAPRAAGPVGARPVGSTPRYVSATWACLMFVAHFGFADVSSFVYSVFLLPQCTADALRRPALARPPLAAATTCCACMPMMPLVSRCTPHLRVRSFLVDCVYRSPVGVHCSSPNISWTSNRCRHSCRHSCHELTQFPFYFSPCPLYPCVIPLVSGPTAVLVMSLLFIGLVVFLHIWGKFRKSIS